jgi:catechol 2,3-dioxygenase-like lactoylglutathione lyase family enzyme
MGGGILGEATKGRPMERPHWQGLNHLALITTDMDATTRFWHEAMGAPLVATVATDDFRHYFFDVGNNSCVAFFEYQGVELEHLAKPAGIPHPRAIQFDHLSLDLPDEEALLALRDRLKQHDCEVTDVVDHGIMRSIYFTDPNGIALEASWWAKDPTGTDGANPDAFGDRNPIPAVADILAGRPLHSPATALVNEATNDFYDVVPDGS